MPVSKSKPPPPPPPTFKSPARPAPPPPPYFFTPAFIKPPKFTVPAKVPTVLKDRVDSSGNLRVTADTADRLTSQTKKPPPPPTFKPKAPPPPTFKPKPKPKPTTTPGSDPVVPPPTTGSAPPPPPVYSEPSYPATPPPPPPPPKIKVAPIDTVIFDDDAVPKEIIADLLFEDIGGQEILTIARHDTVNGQTVLYQPIKNINILQQQYNSENLLKLRDTSDKIFQNFAIDLIKKIPQIGNGPDGSNVYVDESGNIVIEFVSLNSDEIVDVQVTSSGTIYEAG